MPANYYRDIQMIGKHYVIHDSMHHKVKRHYTIANCMQAAQYAKYIELIAKINAGESVAAGLLSFAVNEGTFSVTAKNYKRGLSHKLHNSNVDNTIYEVQGPMGKGLEIQKEGTHIAFTAGTGCLVFVDLVAHLLRKNTGTLDTLEEASQLGNNFKFVLYVSFPTKDDAIALELCQGLQEICNKKGLRNFEFYPRITSEQTKKERWDGDFINKQLSMQDNIKRVWVCGPPVLNELFDKHLLSVKDSIKFSYEIM